MKFSSVVRKSDRELRVINLVDPSERVGWFQASEERPENTMLLVHFIQDFNISRENFDSTINGMGLASLAAGFDLNDDLRFVVCGKEVEK